MLRCSVKHLLGQFQFIRSNGLIFQGENWLKMLHCSITGFSIGLAKQLIIRYFV